MLDGSELSDSCGKRTSAGSIVDHWLVDAWNAVSAAVRRFEVEWSAAGLDSLSGVSARMADRSEGSDNGRDRILAGSIVVCRLVRMWMLP